jgi:hypothetical protein
MQGQVLSVQVKVAHRSTHILALLSLLLQYLHPYWPVGIATQGHVLSVQVAACAQAY